MTRRQRGFTLLELLIAIALMAVLAVLCWRGLDAVLRSRDRVNEASDEMRALTVAFSQMEDDLRRAWPVRLLKIRARDPIAFTASADTAPISMELLRETLALQETQRLQRVVYRLRGQQLERGYAPWLVTSAEVNATVTETNVIWQPLLNDVTSVEFRAYVEEQKSWVTAASLVNTPSVVARSEAAGAQAAAQVAQVAQAVGATPGTSFGRTITGIEVQLERRNGARLVRIFAVKD